jgi:hypothetical protein
MATGGASNFNEIARNPGASSHRTSPVRTFVMQELGLQTPGFWADWAKRKINPAASAQLQDPTQLKSSPQLSQMPQDAITPLNPSQFQDKPVPAARIPQEQQMAGPNQATGKTKKQLQTLEKQVTGIQVRSRIASNPIFSTTSIDAIQTEALNMNRQMLVYMELNPSKMLTDAAKDYFDRHPAGSAISTAQTNFERQMTLYSETQKMAQKLPDYAAGQAMNTVNEAIKKTQKKGSYSSPTYSTGPMLNIGASYGGTKYLSAFG